MACGEDQCTARVEVPFAIATGMVPNPTGTAAALRGVRSPRCRMWSAIDDWYGEDVPEQQGMVKREQPVTPEVALRNSGTGTGTRIVMRNSSRNCIYAGNVRVVCSSEWA